MHFCLSSTGLTSQACMSLHLVSTMDTFYYSLLLFNLCTALGGSTALSCSRFVLCFRLQAHPVLLIENLHNICEYLTQIYNIT